MSPHLIYSFCQKFRRQGGSNIINQHPLEVPVYARYVRFLPVTWKGQICLRVEVYGSVGKFAIYKRAYNNEKNGKTFIFRPNNGGNQLLVKCTETIKQLTFTPNVKT